MIHNKCPKLLLIIFQKCLDHAFYPEIGKHGKLVLLNKPGKDPTDPKFYRPITLLSTLGSVLEKIIIHELAKDIVKNKIYQPNQYAYRSGHSTERAVLEVHNSLLEMKNKYNYVILLSFDISGAFDNIKWSAIISELKSHNIREPLIEIIIYYFRNWTISYLDDEGNTKQNLKAGVPQGSCLGPILFNIVFSKIHRIENKPNVRLVSYADDVALAIGITELREIEQVNKINEKMENVVQSLGALISMKLKL